MKLVMQIKELIMHCTIYRWDVEKTKSARRESDDLDPGKYVQYAWTFNVK